MNIEILEDSDKWNSYVERSTGGTIFHRMEFLQAAAKESGSELYPLVGKKGEHPIAIFPIFIITKGPFQFAFSPPPGTGIRYAGPAFILDPNIKYRKSTKKKKEFINTCINWIDENIAPKFIRVLCQPKHIDSRPYDWSGFDTTPKYTHKLDISVGQDTLLKKFTRDARTSITDAYDTDYEIREVGKEGINFITDRLENRYKSQDWSFSLSKKYLQKVYDNLPDNMVKAYLLFIDDTPISGRLSLMYDDVLVFWQGSPKPREKIDLPANDLLNWHSICQASEYGCTMADLSAANTERLWTNKGKYNPDLIRYNEVVRAGAFTSIGLKGYQWWKNY